MRARMSKQADKAFHFPAPRLCSARVTNLGVILCSLALSWHGVNASVFSELFWCEQDCTSALCAGIRRRESWEQGNTREKKMKAGWCVCVCWSVWRQVLIFPPKRGVVCLHCFLGCCLGSFRLFWFNSIMYKPNKAI